VVKSELVRAINEKLPGLQLSEVEAAVNCLLKHMADTLIQGERIEMRGFGSFNLRNLPAHTARNPKTGETVNSPAKVKVHFKPGEEMRDRVDAARHQYAIEE
jgi:integration host factor subunit beta